MFIKQNTFVLMTGSNQIKIKSLLLSHHHSTSALVSEILESVLQTVQKKQNNLHTDSTYLQTVQKTMCKIHYTYSIHTVYYKDILSYQYTVCTHSTLCTHLYIVICLRCNRLYIYNRLVVQIDSCGKGATDYTYANVVDVHCMVSSDSR